MDVYPTHVMGYGGMEPWFCQATAMVLLGHGPLVECTTSADYLYSLVYDV